MLRHSLPSLCLRCRLTAQLSAGEDELFNRVQHVTRRSRSTKSKPMHSPKVKFTLKQSLRPALQGHHANLTPMPRTFTPFSAPIGKDLTTVFPAKLDQEDCSDYFKKSIKPWSTNHRTLRQFRSFGFLPQDIQPIIDVFAEAGLSGFFSTEDRQKQYYLSRFASLSSSKPAARQIDAETIFSNIFFSWCRNVDDSRVLDELASEGKINESTVSSLRHLAQVAQRQPAEEFPFARKIHRKVIMHVGPTNSGKTHHALRALAASKVGVYAGPLRLLAHEIWERLNLGQIVPLGIDQPAPGEGGIPALEGQPIAVKARNFGNPEYARTTNMVTGEEKKIVSEEATLLSCTVEMLSPRVSYDVGVVDEIQLIGDPHRGFAWTAAVLGLNAKELHLCGEESAIPVVQELLKETGDDLEVRRYERLTPLKVEEKSLGGDYSKVQKGDCVVAFSRSRIFEVKEEIERKSGLRCAVVYGKLPPEIRSEQAALFNDPNSGFDVIIGSDAIGMGLNLKIRRIVFDQVQKTDGTKRLIPLSYSQIKQIAGRAGRYGQSLTGEAPGGYTTTLHEKDLKILRHALRQPFEPITHAHIGATPDTFENIATALPPDTSLEAVQMAHVLASNLPPIYRYSIPNRLADICHFIDSRTMGQLPWAEKHTLFVSPVSWRDELCLQATEKMVRMHRDNMSVGIHQALEDFIFFRALEYMEREMARHNKGQSVNVQEHMLGALESLHKVLVYYMWMHFRYSVVYNEREQTELLKGRVEVALDWGLQQLGRKGLTNLGRASWSPAKMIESNLLPFSKLTPGESEHHSFGDSLAFDSLAKSTSKVPEQEHNQSHMEGRKKIDYQHFKPELYLRHWDKPPDLSTLLNKYVNSLELQPGGNRRKSSSA